MCIKQTTRKDRPLTAGWRGCACLGVCQVVPQYIKVCWLDNRGTSRKPHSQPCAGSKDKAACVGLAPAGRILNLKSPVKGIQGICL